MSLIDDRISLGAVIFDFVTHTKPPKAKYYVVVGMNADKIALGTVLINTDINPNVFRSQKLKDLHISISVNENPFLDYDSYIDCSQLHERSWEDVKNCIDNNSKRYGYVSHLSDKLLHTVINTLASAFTISKAEKNKFQLVRK